MAWPLSELPQEEVEPFAERELILCLFEWNIRQAAEPGHAQCSGRATQAPAVFQMHTDQLCKEETLFGSQFKVVMTPEVIPIAILPELISSFIQIFWWKINKISLNHK